jgi:DNA-binding transcriptional regulator GbsR (MarR family)
MKPSLATSKTDSSSVNSSKQALELESIDFFVRLMGVLGMPRSVGEIYGLLYFSEKPLSMDQISSRLEISIGSASQGLRTLKSLKAIRSTYIAGDRRDHYLAETEFRRLFSSFIKDEIMPHLDSANDRISRMEESLTSNEKNNDFYLVRLEKLKKLTKTGSRLLPALAGLLKL